MMQDAAIANDSAGDEVRKTPLPLRNDTILGICEALGEDFGFNPLLLRIGLAAGLLWNPLAIVGIYLGAGALVAISRFFFPSASRPAAPAAAAAGQAPAQAAASAGSERERERDPELIAA